MQLVVRDPLAMVVAPVQRHVETEGQEAHGAHSTKAQRAAGDPDRPVAGSIPASRANASTPGLGGSLSVAFRFTARYIGHMVDTETAELLAKAMRLPADERLAIATELLDSVEGPEDPEWAAAWAAELDRRVHALESGTAKTIPWSQVKAELQERLRAK